MTAELTLRQPVDAAPEQVWAVALDWERQHEWILGTRVRVTAGDGASEGSEVAATTGVGPLRVTDTMRIRSWEPPRRCVVEHTGGVVRGTGVFTVEARPGDRAVFVWSEQLELPLGAFGRLGWPLVRPVFAWGLRRSLRALARRCRDTTPG